jgi:hypothetical protein
MSGRRSHTRFAVASPWSGIIRVLRDAVVNRAEGDELLAITHTAAVAGEELSLDLMSGAGSLAVKVQVLESRPVMVDGAVRHRVRLALPAVIAEPAVTQSAVPEASDPESAPQVPLAMMTLGVAEAS